MDFVEVGVNVVLLLPILIILACLFFIYRNEKTYKLRTHILRIWEYRAFVSLPAYEKLMYSFRPLSIKRWEKKLSKAGFRKR